MCLEVTVRRGQGKCNYCVSVWEDVFVRDMTYDREIRYGINDENMAYSI